MIRGDVALFPLVESAVESSIVPYRVERIKVKRTMEMTTIINIYQCCFVAHIDIMTTDRQTDRQTIFQYLVTVIAPSDDHLRGKET